MQYYIGFTPEGSSPALSLHRAHGESEEYERADASGILRGKVSVFTAIAVVHLVATRYLSSLDKSWLLLLNALLVLE